MELNTTKEVMQALGGTHAVKDLTGRSYSAAHNWWTKPKFPANTYKTMTDALAEKGLSAPDQLWSQAK